MADVASEYRRAFEATTSLVFASPEWLEAVGADRVRILDVGADVGAPAFVPVEVSRRSGLVRVSNPPLTPWLYPVGGNPGTTNPARIANANRIGAAVATVLPRAAYVKLRLHPLFPSYLGFHWEDFLALARISYRIDPCPSEAAWEGLRGELRTDIRRARRNSIEVRWDEALSEAASLFEAHATGAGFSHPMSAGQLAFFLGRVVERGVGRVGTAWCGGELCAAVVVARDPTCAYYLLAASDDAGRRAKAMSLLTWTAVAEALDDGLAFDFTGSMLHGVEHFNRAFGGRQVLDALVVRPPLGRSALRLARQVTRRALAPVSARRPGPLR